MENRSIVLSTLLEVKNLKKYFPTPKGMLYAVDGVNFSLEKGKTLGIVGESGCGKSTLGRLIVHLLVPTDGEIIFEGIDITRPQKQQLHNLRRDMQMIFQDPYSSLNPRMTVSEIIGEPLEIYHICKNNSEFNEKIGSLMETVGLARRYVNSYPHELDGGRRQRIGVARALALDPKFIVCDEPVSALDVSIQAQILNLLQDLQDKSGFSYIFITHNLSVVKHISDDIGVMYLGHLVEKCQKNELFKNQLHPYTKALLSAIPRINIRIKTNRILLKGELSSPIDPGENCRFSTRCLYAQEKCYSNQPQLVELEKEHFVACHFAQEIKDGSLVANV
jgi:peptide/nickel transport system ATP-binding protein